MAEVTLEIILAELKKHDLRFDRIEQRLDKIDKRLDAMDRRFDGVDRKLELIATQTARTVQDVSELNTRVSELEGPKA